MLASPFALTQAARFAVAVETLPLHQQSEHPEVAFRPFDMPHIIVTFSSAWWRLPAN